MVNKWETFFLLILTLPIMGHVVILPLTYDVGGRDSWISVPLSLPFAFLFAYVIYRLRLRFPKKGFVDLIHATAGRWVGSLILLLFILYFLFLSALSLAALIDMTNASFLTETPSWALGGTFLLLVIYGTTKKVRGIALTSAILTLIVMFTGHSITFLNAGKREFDNIYPILEFGWMPPFWGAVVLMNVWIELFLLVLLPFRNIYEKRMFLVWSLGIFFNALMMLSTLTGTMMTFGLNQADNFVYPALEVVRIIDIGFFDRLDIYGLILMTFGTYIRCSLFLRLSYEQVAHLTPERKWVHYLAFGIFVLIIFIGSMYIADSTARVADFVTIYAFSIVLYPLPFLLLLIAKLRKVGYEP